jgi:ArsR family transcriptional regulator
MLDIATATVSRHMSILQNARLVKNRKEGRWVFYRLSDSFPPLLKSWLKQSMSHAEEVALDNKNLKMILCCDPDELCKSQKNKRRRHDRKS